jgi:predicted XRE-type DNA-binding protein
MASKTAKVIRATDNVFADIGFGPEEAAHLRIRSLLMATLRQALEAKGLTQAQSAKMLGVSQPRVSDLVRGKIEQFSIDTLVDMLARAGFEVALQVEQVA